MHTNWEPLKLKWGTLRIDADDERLIDISQCSYVGDGPHEICLFTLDRYIRHAEVMGNRGYPVLVAFRSWFSHHVDEEEPAIYVIRSLRQFTSALPSKLRLLAVVSCRNGSSFCEALRRELPPPNPNWLRRSGSQNWSWHESNISSILEASNRILTTNVLPPFIEQPRIHTGVAISISADQFVVQFPGYFPSEDERGKPEGWWGNLRKRVPRGEQILAPHPERVVLCEDMRRLADGLYRGQLGWTIPSKGLFKKKGSKDYWVSITTDCGTTLDVNLFWIDFLKPEKAVEVSRKIIASYRGTPFDADETVAEQWSRVLPEVDASQMKIIGRGLHEVYAFTFWSCVETANRTGLDRYPMKIGYTAAIDGALRRIQSQIHDSISPEPARVLLIGRCGDGRAVESAIHRELKNERRQFDGAVGREWFESNISELEKLFCAIVS